MAIWAQIKTNKQQQQKQSLAAISAQGPLIQTAIQGEACSELPAQTMFLPCEAVLVKEFLESYFNQ